MGTQCFHRDGNQDVGMGDCQLRSGKGQRGAPVHGLPGVQYPDASIAAEPFECVGHGASDDNRPSLYGGG